MHITNEYNKTRQRLNEIPLYCAYKHQEKTGNYEREKYVCSGYAISLAHHLCAIYMYEDTVMQNAHLRTKKSIDYIRSIGSEYHAIERDYSAQEIHT